MLRRISPTRSRGRPIDKRKCSADGDEQPAKPRPSLKAVQGSSLSLMSGNGFGSGVGCETLYVGCDVFGCGMEHEILLGWVGSCRQRIDQQRRCHRGCYSEEGFATTRILPVRYLGGLGTTYKVVSAGGRKRPVQG
jgi:hypothetical protein